MAARKSCTHMTWAEAKAKVGGGGSGGGGGKAKQPPKKVAHSKVLAEKIIAKSGNPQEKTISRAKLRRAQKEDEKAAAAIAAAREAEKEERRKRTVKPHEQAKIRMAELAKKIKAKPLKNTPPTTATAIAWDASDMAKMMEIKECKEMQLDEIMALEAIYADTEEFVMSDASQLEKISELRERLYDDESDEEILRSIVEHPLLSFTIQLKIDHTHEDNDSDPIDMLGCLLVRIDLPPQYPLQENPTPPIVELVDVMFTDKAAVCSPDKTLESLVFLREKELFASMAEEINELLPDPCVYQIVMWLSEHAVNYLEMRTHARIS